MILDSNAPNQNRKPDISLLKAVARAHDWFGRLLSEEARSVSEIAKMERVTASYVTRVIRLAFLAPEITEKILDGSHPASLTANRLINKQDFPLDWEKQLVCLGF